MLPGSSSEEEDAISLAESRFGSLKRRGRPKYRRNNTAAVPAEEERKEQESNDRDNVVVFAAWEFQQYQGWEQQLYERGEHAEVGVEEAEGLEVGVDDE